MVKVGRIVVAGFPAVLEPDADLDDYFEPIVIDPVERCKLYGMMRFGNMVSVHSFAVGWGVPALQGFRAIESAPIRRAV